VRRQPPADALARCVGDVDAFRSTTFGVAPHRWRDPGGFDDVLALADVDRALTGAGLRRPAFRLVRDGEILPPSSYTRTARTGSQRIDDLIDPGRVLDLFAEGATIVLQALQRWWPPATRFCRDLELGLGHPIQANAYLTPAGAAGLAPHHDTHDVFVLQVAGTKHWAVRAPVVDTPLARHVSDHDAAAAQPVLFEAELEPGDALYLPRGFVHSAAAQDGVSLHLTVGVLATTVHDVLREVVDLAGEDIGFRRSLPPGWPYDDATAGAAVKAAVADLVEWLGRVDPDTVAERLRDGFVRNRSPLLGGQLLELARLDRLDDDTVVVRREGTIATVTLPADESAGVGGDADESDRRNSPPPLRLTLGDRRLAMPAALEPAVRRLLDGSPHRVGDLADLLDEPSRSVLVRRLVREGALRTDPPADG
jgi:bifunctional lysine-specific demethylase and histidyl-hydroxylase NO66